MSTNTQEAEARLARLWSYVQADPSNLTLLRDIAAQGLQHGLSDHTVKAVQALHDLAQADARDDAAAILALSKGRQTQQALAYAQEAMARWPDDEAVRVEIARAMLNVGQFTELAALPDVSDQEPALQQMMGELKAQAWWHLGELETAAQLLRPLAQTYPDNPTLLALLSAVLHDLDEHVESTQAAKAAYALSPRHAYQAQHVLASDKLMAGDTTGAMKHVQEAMAVRQDDGRIWLLSGATKLMQGSTEAAVADLQRTVSLFSEHPGSYLTLAWAHIMRKELDAAEAVVQQAIDVSPAFADSHGTLAVVQAMKGDEAAARQSIRRATLLDKQGAAAQYAQLVLDGLPQEQLDALLRQVLARAA